jgi:BTB/POZ domain
LKNIDEELQMPGKYQIQIITTIRASYSGNSLQDLKVADTGYCFIKYDRFFWMNEVQVRHKDIYRRLSPSGSLLLDVKVSLKYLPADFKFIVKGKEFKVHRNILAAASPVFTKLFTADMEEAQNGECIVNDIEPEIFELLLRFIHKGKLLEDIDAVLTELYEAAHYYQIDELKEVCKKELPAMLKTENAEEMFHWAHVYDEHELKTAAWKIVKR